MQTVDDPNQYELDVFQLFRLISSKPAGGARAKRKIGDDDLSFLQRNRAVILRHYQKSGIPDQYCNFVKKTTPYDSLSPLNQFLLIPADIMVLRFPLSFFQKIFCDAFPVSLPLLFLGYPFSGSLYSLFISFFDRDLKGLTAWMALWPMFWKVLTIREDGWFPRPTAISLEISKRIKYFSLFPTNLILQWCLILGVLRDPLLRNIVPVSMPRTSTSWKSSRQVFFIIQILKRLTFPTILRSLITFCICPLLNVLFWWFNSFCY